MSDRLLMAKAFVLVAQSLSFTKAADILGLSVTVVSRQVTALERQLGVRLMNRTTRSVTLTAQGKALLPRFQALLQQADELFAPAQMLEGRLRVAASMPFFDLEVVSLLAAFQKEHPKLQLDFTLTSEPLDLVRDAIDIGLQEGTEVAAGYIARALGLIKSWMVATPEYLQEKGEPTCLEDLKHHCLLTLSSCHDIWSFEDKSDPTLVQELKINPSFAANYSNALLSMCLAGNGIAFQPIMATAPLVQAGRLQVVLPQWRGVPRIVYAAVASRLNLSPPVRELLAYISAHIVPTPAKLPKG